MATLQVHKTTALPGNLTPNSVYFVAPTSGPADYLEVYVTDAAGVVVRKTPTRSQIQAMIDAAVAASAGSGTVIADDIAARDALTPVNAQRVIVIDATADPTVETGGAEYVWQASNSIWVKVSEFESQNLSVSWEALIGKPASTPAEIDDAVARRHNHANFTQLDKVGEDEDGNFTYGGTRPGTPLETGGW